MARAARTIGATCAVLGEPGEDAQVLHFSVPLAAPGVRLEETWDTLGMRGTASHDVVLADVFVPADKISARRPYGAGPEQRGGRPVVGLEGEVGAHPGLVPPAGAGVVHRRTRSAAAKRVVAPL